MDLTTTTFYVSLLDMIVGTKRTIKVDLKNTPSNGPMRIDEVNKLVNLSLMFPNRDYRPTSFKDIQ